MGDGTRDVEKLTGLFSRRMSSDGNPDFLPRKLSSLHLQHLLRNSKRICRTQLKSDSNSDGNPDFLPRKLISCHLHRRPSSSKSSPSFLMSDVLQMKMLLLFVVFFTNTLLISTSEGNHFTPTPTLSESQPSVSDLIL